jgi:hypothetical protein
MRWKRATGLPATELKSLADKIAKGDDLGASEVNIYGRLGAILSAVIDAAYEKADQLYRNAAKTLAAVIAIVLALIGGYAAAPAGGSWLLYAAIGAVATPLAPIADRALQWRSTLAGAGGAPGSGRVG